jgi:hypothetical protein
MVVCPSRESSNVDVNQLINIAKESVYMNATAA